MKKKFNKLFNKKIANKSRQFPYEIEVIAENLYVP